MLRMTERLRKALVLPGESPETVVAGVCRHGTYRKGESGFAEGEHWKTPVIVSTARIFFETLSANKPWILCKLHCLSGSAILIDEMYETLPNKLLKVTWHWMQVLSREWGCRWVVSSNSSVKFWEFLDMIQELKDDRVSRTVVPELLPKEFIKEYIDYESQKVEFVWENTPLSCQKLTEKVTTAPGPCLLVMSTIHNAAVMEEKLKSCFNDEAQKHVFYLPSECNAEDTERIMGTVKKWSQSENTNWVLVTDVGTGIENGLFFQTVFHEVTSSASLFQAASAIGKKDGKTKVRICSFSMQDDSRLKKNSKWKDSFYVLRRYFQRAGSIARTEATNMGKAEWRCGVTLDQAEKLYLEEMNRAFPYVQKEYHLSLEEASKQV